MASLSRSCRGKSPPVSWVSSRERLLGTAPRRVSEERAGSARAAARRFGAVALLKGAGTIIDDGRRSWANTTGNAAMASGGMGDVLTGIIAATWAQMPGRDLDSGAKAAALGAYVHGLAADLAVKRFNAFARLQSDLAEAKGKLAERDLIDKAKRILMDSRGFSEPQAYTELRKTAMNQGRRIVDIADAVVTAHQLMGGK